MEFVPIVYVLIKLRSPYTRGMHDRGQAPDGWVDTTGTFLRLRWLAGSRPDCVVMPQREWQQLQSNGGPAQ